MDPQKRQRISLIADHIIGFLEYATIFNLRLIHRDFRAAPFFSEARDDFPYKRNTGNMLTDIAARLRAMMQWRPVISSDPYTIHGSAYTARDLQLCLPGCAPTFARMALQGEDYVKYNLITDFFIEQHRIRALHGSQSRESVYDFWCKHKAPISRIAEDTHQNAREIIYHATTEVGTFRPTVMAGLIWFLRDHLRARFDYILDPCAGWGDRLIGAIAANARVYVSADPNAALAPEYKRMISWAHSVLPNIKTNVMHFATPFEDISVENLLQTLMRARTSAQARSSMPAPDDGYDLAMTSPPYFNLETYDRDDRARVQSTTRYPIWSVWYKRFLLAMMRAASASLRVGGILGIVISLKNDQSFRALLRDMQFPFEYRASQPGGAIRRITMCYIGTVAFSKYDFHPFSPHAYEPSPQPIFLWMRA